MLQFVAKMEAVEPGNKHELFKKLDEEFSAITFDELTIENETPSQLDWRHVDLSSRISRNITCKTPILTSPMSTITEDEMAIAAAKEGGGGVIHHANTPEEQKRLVRRVKLHLNGLIDSPVTFRENVTIEETLNEIENQGHKFKTFPVVDENNRFTGLMTNTHFELFSDEDKSLPLSDAMTPAGEIATASSETDVSDAYAILRDRKIKLLPLLNNDNQVTGLYLLPDVLRTIRGNPENYNLDNEGRLRTFMSVSTYDIDAIARVKESQKYLDMVVIDTSHGESKYNFSTYEALKRICKTTQEMREEFSDVDIMVGNVSDASLAVALAKEGPDSIRVGRGPGGICISREKLGGGVPQASAIYNCSVAVKEIDPDITICADGGIRGPGDFVKALSLSNLESTIMVGSYVAATDEAAAPVQTRADGTQYKEYNGAASAKEQKKSLAAILRYDPELAYSKTASQDDIFVEGVEKEFPLQGPVSRKFRELTRGAKIEMCTGGFSNIKALQAGVRYRRVTAAGANEGRASI